MASTILPYTPAHQPGLQALIPPIQREEFGIAITWADQTDLHDVAAHYAAFWVAETPAGRVVGSIGLMDIGGGAGVIRKMFVAADHRGGGAGGVAGRLLATLVADARRRGMAALWLGTTEKFLAAHRFYERAGFQAVPVEALPATFPRMAVDTRFYRLELTAPLAVAPTPAQGVASTPVE